VEAGSSKIGKSNINQSLVVDKILAAIAWDLVCDIDREINVDEKAPPLGATLDLLGLTCKSGTAQLKQVIQKQKELLVAKRGITECKMIGDSEAPMEGLPEEKSSCQAGPGELKIWSLPQFIMKPS
jgi:hypothetical protein